PVFNSLNKKFFTVGDTSTSAPSNYDPSTTGIDKPAILTEETEENFPGCPARAGKLILSGRIK
ncbi:MAG: hypothetical protein WEB62_11300, partial [Bacteroidota bacterium]